MAKTINEILIEALSFTGLPVLPDFYAEAGERYFTFNPVLDRPVISGDDGPVELVGEYQLHYFCPLDEDYLDMQRRVRRALLDAGATYPEITDASVQDGQIRHVVFTFEIENDFDLADDDE